MPIKSPMALIAATLLACAVVAQYLFVYPKMPDNRVTPEKVKIWKGDCGKEGTAPPCKHPSGKKWSRDDRLKHENRWERVLKALKGEPGGMIATEAQSYFNKHGWERWVPTAATLATLEARSAYWNALLNIASTLATLLATVLVIFDWFERRRQ